MDYLLVAVMSLDVFFACMAYSVRTIKIPLCSKAVIAGIGTVFLAISLLFRHWITLFLSGGVIKFIGFTVLILMGLINIFEDKTKSFFRHKLKLKFHFFRFIIEVYLDQTKADVDNSKVLSPGEARTLAIPLSIDSLITGLSIALTWKKALILLPFSFVFGITAATIGTVLGEKTAAVSTFNSSYFSGILLITIAVLKMI